MGGSRSAGPTRPLVPLVSWCALALLIGPGAVRGQVPEADREPDPAAAPSADRYWHVLTYTVAPDRLDALREYLRTVAAPVAEALERRGELLERRWLVRDFGRDYSFVVMSRWADPRDLWTERTPEDELEAAFPDGALPVGARHRAARALAGLPYTSAVYREAGEATPPGARAPEDR